VTTPSPDRRAAGTDPDPLPDYIGGMFPKLLSATLDSCATPAPDREFALVAARASAVVDATVVRVGAPSGGPLLAVRCELRVLDVLRGDVGERVVLVLPASDMAALQVGDRVLAALAEGSEGEHRLASLRSGLLRLRDGEAVGPTGRRAGSWQDAWAQARATA
jgi:hypothetical protein